MDSNLSLKLGFKGQLKLNAQAVPLHEGYLKDGGIVDVENQSKGLPFGVVCSAPEDTPDIIVAGKGSGNVIRGIVAFSDEIAQNAVAAPGVYLAGMPCAFIVKGLVQLENWEEGKDPKIGYKVQYKNDTGVIGFVSSSADANHTLLADATVVKVTDSAAFVWLG
jgi:hypothetical protein